MEQRNSLMENIVQRVSAIFQRREYQQEEPETDSSKEVRTGMGMDNSTGRGAYDWYMEELAISGKRLEKYREYDRMDTESVEVSSALDIYADNATSGDRDTNETIEVISESEKVIEIITEVKDRLGLDFEIWSIAREMVKYGDCFEEVVVYPDLEVHRLKHLAPDTMTIRADKWGRLDPQKPYAQVNDLGESLAEFEPWQVIHFKMDKDRDSRYGVNGSMLYPLRKVYKQLAMIEDSLVITRLTRAQQRFAYTIDVTGIEPGESTKKYLQDVKNSMKKKRTIDPITGEMNLKYNPLSVEEDIFLASREGGGSDVKVLQGASNLSQLQDVEYFSKKLFAGLKVPKAWMGFEGDTRARAVITELDVQFAKTIRRVQLSLIEGLRKLFDFVLITRGVNPLENQYTLKLPILSAVDELRQWQLESLKANVAAMYLNQLNVSNEWVYTNLLELSDEDIEAMKGIIDDEESIFNKMMNRQLAYAEIVKGSEQEGQEGMEESSLTSRDVSMLRYRLKEEIKTLKELTSWEYENKTGQSL